MLRMRASRAGEPHLDGALHPRLPQRRLRLELAVHNRATVLHQAAAPKHVCPDARRVVGHARKRRWRAPCRSAAEPGADSDQSGTRDRSHPRHRGARARSARSADIARRRRSIGTGSGHDPGTSVAAVKSRLHRARVAIREDLAPALGRPAIAPLRGARCPDVLTLFSQHLEGEIDPGVCATMEAHLAHCHHCRDACESLKRTLAVCRQLPTPDVPESVAASVKAAIHAFLNDR
jgi:hypothetical protein